MTHFYDKAEELYAQCAPVIKLIAVMAVIGIAVLSLLPGDMRPHTVMPGKLEHVIAYLLTAGALVLGYGASRHPAFIAIALSIYSALLEIAQIKLPGRHADILDFIVSSAGAALGCFLAWLLLRYSSRSISNGLRPTGR